MKRRIVLLCVLALACPTLLLGQAHDRHMAEAAASAQVTAVPGGATISIEGPYEKVFDALVPYLQKAGYSVDTADRQAGLVATSLQITGGWKQTGTRIVITVIKDTATSTSLRVACTVQKRYKGLQVEPWGDPKVDDKASAEQAKKIQSELPTQLAKS